MLKIASAYAQAGSLYDDGSTADDMANYHSELTLITEKLEAKGIKVILFARIWLSNKTDDYVISLLDTYLSTLDITERNCIGGIALTEIHLSDIVDFKTRAQSIPTKFATAYPNWLKPRMFLLPGLDNGFHFSGIEESDAIHSEMSELVGESAFVIKTMKLKASQDTVVSISEEHLCIRVTVAIIWLAIQLFQMHWSEQLLNPCSGMIKHIGSF
ncbi:hypothetical protein [Thalassotalea sp. ND16A]|uniref:hypothetical protein n=1 Tax=Thalassotalea sp. ND16A TaxID=1535422 RepID=UPI00051A4293|nr:hypothetical protein [Thalassotalea sp. ND16A]KGK00091.1 hypothetical protein ND16A_0282 [Thalassotalea sp. ND16A]